MSNSKINYFKNLKISIFWLILFSTLEDRNIQEREFTSIYKSRNSFIWAVLTRVIKYQKCEILLFRRGVISLWIHSNRMSKHFILLELYVFLFYTSTDNLENSFVLCLRMQQLSIENDKWTSKVNRCERLDAVY